jgi:molybdate transport system regulatory protein
MSPPLHNASFVTPVALRFDGGEISPRRLALLEAIGRLGSINAAAKEVGITYKAAWDAVEAMNNLAGARLVAARHGGSGGGGADLTDAGRAIVSAWGRLVALQDEFLRHCAGRAEDAGLLALIRRLNMRTSARNALYGTVTSVREGAVNAEVSVELACGDTLHAIVTMESLRDMGLAAGMSAWALIKASWVILAAPDEGLKTSARNRLCGRITRIARGAVNTEVVLELAGGATLAAIITEVSTDRLGLAVGDEACALIKASHVILGVD